MPNCTQPSLSACLKTKLHLVPVSETGKCHTLALKFGGWPFTMTVTRYFRPKTDHSNERVYHKPIYRKLKALANEGLGSFLRLFTSELWKLCRFLDKKKRWFKIFKHFLSKNKFTQSTKSTKNCSFKYNGYRSMITVAQNFGHIHNKDFNLYTRQIYFTDQNCVILRS